MHDIAPIAPAAAPPAWLAAPGPWLQTQSGLAFDLLDPRPEQVALCDIAASLARLPRFNGQTLRGREWSVADHSMLVSDLVAAAGASPTVQLLALLHDAHEAYIGDLTTPLVGAISRLIEAICRVELDPVSHLKAMIDGAIRTAFGLPAILLPDTEALIDAADRQALRLERHHLMAPPPRPWAGDGADAEACHAVAWYHPCTAGDFAGHAMYLLGRRHQLTVPAAAAAAG